MSLSCRLSRRLGGGGDGTEDTPMQALLGGILMHSKIGIIYNLGQEHLNMSDLDLKRGPVRAETRTILSRKAAATV